MNTQITIADLVAKMRDHDRENAPGSESAQWGTFCQDCMEQYCIMPFDEEAEKILPDESFVGYWDAVACQDYETAAKFGEVPDEWEVAK